VLTSWEGNDCYNYSPLIRSFRQTNVAITGQGTLDGRASNARWWPWFGDPAFGWQTGMPRQGTDSSRLKNQGETGVPVSQRLYGPGHYLRPHFIEPYGCTNVLIEGVTIRNAPFWAIHPIFSASVTIRNVKVISQGPNNDGCDVECCKDVLVSGCYFDTYDDCIVVKSGRGRDGLISPRRESPSRDIVLRSNRVSRGGGAIAIGSEQSAGIHHVYVDGLTGDNAGLYTGVLIKANPRYGAGIVEEIHVRNVVLVGVRNRAVLVTSRVYGLTSGPYRPTFRGINVSGMTCGGSQNALRFEGLPDKPIQSVRVTDSAFNNVTGTGVVKSDITGLTLANVRVNGQLVVG
jgi:polygalacturonase